MSLSLCIILYNFVGLTCLCYVCTYCGKELSPWGQIINYLCICPFTIIQIVLIWLMRIFFGFLCSASLCICSYFYISACTSCALTSSRTEQVEWLTAYNHWLSLLSVLTLICPIQHKLQCNFLLTVFSFFAVVPARRPSLFPSLSLLLPHPLFYYNINGEQGIFHLRVGMRKRACQIRHRHWDAMGYLCSMLMGFYLHVSAKPELCSVFCCNGTITMVLAKTIILSCILRVIKLMWHSVLWLLNVKLS